MGFGQFRKSDRWVPPAFFGPGTPGEPGKRESRQICDLFALRIEEARRSGRPVFSPDHVARVQDPAFFRPGGDCGSFGPRPFPGTRIRDSGQARTPAGFCWRVCAARAAGSSSWLLPSPAASSGRGSRVCSRTARSLLGRNRFDDDAGRALWSEGNRRSCRGFLHQFFYRQFI